MTFYGSRIPNARQYLNGMTRICYGLGLMVFIAVSGAPTLNASAISEYLSGHSSKSNRTSETATKSWHGSHHRGASSRVQPPDDPACTGQTARRPSCAAAKSWRWSDFGIDEKKTSRVSMSDL